MSSAKHVLTVTAAYHWISHLHPSYSLLLSKKPLHAFFPHCSICGNESSLLKFIIGQYSKHNVKEFHVDFKTSKVECGW